MPDYEITFYEDMKCDHLITGEQWAQSERFEIDIYGARTEDDAISEAWEEVMRYEAEGIEGDIQWWCEYELYEVRRVSTDYQVFIDIYDKNTLDTISSVEYVITSTNASDALRRATYSLKRDYNSISDEGSADYQISSIYTLDDEGELDEHVYPVYSIPKIDLSVLFDINYNRPV